jgi:hypothetical protein
MSPAIDEFFAGADDERGDQENDEIALEAEEFGGARWRKSTRV